MSKSTSPEYLAFAQKYLTDETPMEAIANTIGAQNASKAAKAIESILQQQNIQKNGNAIVNEIQQAVTTAVKTAFTLGASASIPHNHKPIEYVEFERHCREHVAKMQKENSLRFQHVKYGQQRIGTVVRFVNAAGDICIGWSRCHADRERFGFSWPMGVMKAIKRSTPLSEVTFDRVPRKIQPALKQVIARENRNLQKQENVSN